MKHGKQTVEKLTGVDDRFAKCSFGRFVAVPQKTMSKRRQDLPQDARVQPTLNRVWITDRAGR